MYPQYQAPTLWERQSMGSADAVTSSTGVSIAGILSAIGTALVAFGVQLLVFIAIKNKLARIYKPKTYLVPEKERTEPPPRSPFGWLISIFQFSDREIIKKCGLDAYFFLRYLQTLLFIFVPLAIVILPILLPLNISDGRGVGTKLPGGTTSNVTGLDGFSWGNVKPVNYLRYWAHLVLALLVICWVCFLFWAELRIYIRVRQDYLTSAEHRLRASATTILVSSIPEKWLTHEGLSGLYDVFPGGIRNIWLNRNYDVLLDKIKERNKIARQLEGAETELVRIAKKNQKKQAEKEAKKQGLKKATKQEKAAEEKAQDEAAKRVAAQTDGVSSGDQEVPDTVDGAVDEAQEAPIEEGQHKKSRFKVPALGAGMRGIGEGFNKGLGLVTRAGDEFTEGGQKLVTGIDGQLQTTNGFIDISPTDQKFQDPVMRDAYRMQQSPGYKNATGNRSTEAHDIANRSVSSRGTAHEPQRNPFKTPDLREHKDAENFGGMRANQTIGGHGWWKFWKPPAGGFPSPLPSGYEEGDEFPLTGTDASTKKDPEKSTWQKIKSKLPFVGGEEIEPIEYPHPYNKEYKEDTPGGAVWEKYAKQKDRPTHRLPIVSWMFSLPLIGKKVDTIYWCRGELARLNVEVEEDQKHPERFPLMNSAFIQFNHQVAAHMASQSLSHHVPKQMAPRNVEISPSDVIWDNMSVNWWQAWGRIAVVSAIVVAMVALWAFPVAWSATLSNLTELINRFSWLGFLQNNKTVANAVSGVLPAVVLAIVLAIVPLIFYQLAIYSGVQTGNQKELMVQNWYFAFLFVQVFLVVSISGGATGFLTAGTDAIGNPANVPSLLAGSLPSAANYFFSYMILQALSTSAGTLLQIATLVLWFVMPKFFDNTARQKWSRNTTLPNVSWGTFFPVYTNFACITIIYSVIAPLILVFGIVTFSLLWIANRYNMLYVSRFRIDTGGLVYPKAINQTFTGLYFMELVLIGLFLLVRNDDNQVVCYPQAIIMLVALISTIAYQVLLNRSFSPLFYHLPITFEDDAVIRDKAFEMEQAQRLNLVNEDDVELADEQASQQRHSSHFGPDIEMKPIGNSSTQERTGYRRFDPRNVGNAVVGGGTWAAKNAGNLAGNIANLTFGRDDSAFITKGAKARRHRDSEAQKRIGNALFSGYADEIEDLTPEERDVLVKRAFQHAALRERRPTVWIPRDDLGVSDDEVRRTREFAGKSIWISNEGTALDTKVRVVYGRNPPDFSEVDLIQL